MNDCEQLIWPELKSAFSDSIQFEQEDNLCHVTVPFEKADQDAVSLWIRQDNDSYIITDEGETYGMLYLSNVNLNQDRRTKRLQSIKQRFDLDKAKYEVRLRADEATLGRRVIDAVQAVQSISYLLYTRRQYTQSDFRGEVGDYLSEQSYEYIPNAKINGISEGHRVDYSIKLRKPAYLEALHAEDESTAHSVARRTAYKWTDISKADPDATLISTLNDESGEYDDRTVKILTEYSDAYVPWSERSRIKESLSASNAGASAD